MLLVFELMKIKSIKLWLSEMSFGKPYLSLNHATEVYIIQFDIDHSSFSVGKTSLITRFMYDSFDNTYQVL